MEFVKFENVSLAYDEGGPLAIENIDIEVRENEFVAMVGPSGCGKSTLMKLVSGLREPSAGYVYLGGRQVGGPQKCIGMAFQASNLLPWRTTLQNVMLPLEIVEPYRSNLRRERQAYEQQARALLVLGSSLTVQSGLRFVRAARKQGKPVVILNDGPTRADPDATVRVHGRLEDVLDRWSAGAAGRGAG